MQTSEPMTVGGILDHSVVERDPGVGRSIQRGVETSVWPAPVGVSL